MDSNKFQVKKVGASWVWELHGASDPHSGPIARSGRTYTTKEGAMKSIVSAKAAMRTSRVLAPFRGKSTRYKVSKYNIERAD